MYDQEIKRVKCELQKLDEEGIFENRKIGLFGFSDNSKQIIHLLRERGKNPSFVLDNDTKKQNSLCAGVEVLAVQMLESLQEECVILIYSKFWQEMEKQILSISANNIYVYVMYKRNISFNEVYEEAENGEKLYYQLTKEFGCNKLFLCPYTGTGDIYLIGTFWEAYVKKNNLKEYIFIVITSACEKVTRLFEIKNVVALKRKDDSERLIQYYMMNRETVDLKLLNDSWAKDHANVIEWFRGFKGLNFRIMFSKFVFDFPSDSWGKHAKTNLFCQEVKSIFQKQNLEEGKTVVISPYSNTLSELPDVFWIKIAKALKHKGYIVCTNCGNEKESEIKGTIRVSFPLHYAPQFVQKAGFFLGVRSGFCDIVSGTSARKVILYNRDERFYNSSAYEYFSLNETYICEETYELELDLKKLEEGFKDVLQLLVNEKI